MNPGDLTKNPMNLIDVDRPKSIFDPNSEWMRELEIYKLKSSASAIVGGKKILCLKVQTRREAVK